jgi:Asp-tRNA(Asn)/Glu-tRNA(Gln) amidotransferase A subunit family amidase
VVDHCSKAVTKTALPQTLTGLTLARRIRRGITIQEVYTATETEYTVDVALNELHSRIGLADLVGRRVQLTRDGHEYVGRCPFHGMPYALKDIIDVEGIATTAHSKVMTGNAASRDAAVTERLQAAGAVLLGKLSTHEFAIGGPSFEHV